MKANEWWIINHILKHDAWCHLITLPSHLNGSTINEFDSIQHTGSRCHSQLVTSEQFAAHYWIAYNILWTGGSGGTFIKSYKVDCDWRTWQDIICLWRSMFVFLGYRRINLVWSEINILRLRWYGCHFETLQNNFLVWKLFYLYSNFTELCYQGSN